MMPHSRIPGGVISVITNSLVAEQSLPCLDIARDAGALPERKTAIPVVVRQGAFPS